MGAIYQKIQTNQIKWFYLLWLIAKFYFNKNGPIVRLWEFQVFHDAQSDGVRNCSWYKIWQGSIYFDGIRFLFHK